MGKSFYEEGLFVSIRFYSVPFVVKTPNRSLPWPIAGRSVIVHSRLFMVWPIRKLVTADGAAFRELRLEALQTYPDAFGSTYENEVMRPVSSFVEPLEKNVILGCLYHVEIA